MMTSSGVTVTTVVSADQETAFRAFTEDINVWWRSGSRFRVDASRESSMRLEPRVGGRFLEIYDEAQNDAYEHGKVRVWDPVSRVVFEMRGRDFEPDERTEVEVTFSTVARGTRVTVHHRGWDTLPADHPVRHGLDGGAFTNMMSVWWGDLLTAARSHVTELGARN